ncbi:MAG: hypothetical protein U0R79_03290 [Propionicimonas sp.]
MKVALRSRETLALIRPVGDVLRMHTMCCGPTSSGTAPSPRRRGTKSARPRSAWRGRSSSSSSGDFDLSQFSDDHREALEKVIDARLEGVELPAPTGEAPKEAQVVDLVAALRASVEAAKARRAEAAAS